MHLLPSSFYLLQPMYILFFYLTSPIRFTDGLSSNQKYQFGSILEGVAMEDVGIFNGNLVYFIAIWHILRLFGIFEGNSVYFTRFGKL
jgi:hypothetical protein